MPEEVLDAEVMDSTAGVEEQVDSVATENVETTEEQIEGEQPELIDDAKPEDDAEVKAAKEDAELVKQLQEKGVPSKYKDILKKEPFLRDSVMGYKAFRAEFPQGLKEAREYRDLVSEIGGKEGIEALRADVKAGEDLDALVMAGDPQAIEAILKTSPEGFVKLMPSALEKFQAADPDAYNHVLGRVVFNTIKDSAVLDAYHALVKAGDNDSAKKLADFYNHLEALASKQPEKKVDAERQKFEAEKKSFEENKKEEFSRGVSGEMRTFNAKTLEGELAKQFKAAGKDYEAFKKKAPDSVIEMLNSCNNALLKEMEKDATFVKQHNSLLEARDRAKVLAMTQKKVSSVAAEAVKRVYRLFNAPGTAPAPKKPGAVGVDNKPVAAGTIRLSKAPEPQKIDRQRTTDDMIFDNTAYLLGRKEKFVWA